MINKNNYIKIWKDEETFGVLYSMVRKAHTENEYANFCEWMSGQTCGLNEKNEAVIYSWDYERWISQKMKKEQGADWD